MVTAGWQFNLFSSRGHLEVSLRKEVVIFNEALLIKTQKNEKLSLMWKIFFFIIW